MANKILAVVKFNSGEAYVMRDPIVLSYKKINPGVIVGTDGTFVNSYYYETPSGRFQAFAGREFTITLDNGEVEKCKGQWWSGMPSAAREYIGKPLINVTACHIDQLKKCYVFYGYSAVASEIQALRAEYKGIIYRYYDYDFLINGRQVIARSAAKRIKTTLRNARVNAIRKPFIKST